MQIEKDIEDITITSHKKHNKEQELISKNEKLEKMKRSMFQIK